MSKSTMPILLAAGAAALLLSKKKTTSPTMAKKPKKPVDDYMVDVGGDEKIIMDAECSSIVNKVNFSKNDAWLTNRYYDLLDSGVNDLDQLTLQVLIDQSEHCPWLEKGKWTPFMSALYDQLNSYIKKWHETMGDDQGNSGQDNQLPPMPKLGD